MLKIKNYIFAVALLMSVAVTVPAQTPAPGSVLIVYDSSGSFGWIGGLHAKMLANLMGHFDLPYLIKPVENYAAGDMNAAAATFYLGTVYDNPLPAVFRTDVMAGTNRLCWFKYNIWQIGGESFESKYGFRFNSLDSSGYSNIVYKGETFLKNQLDSELGNITILDTNLATVVATAKKANGDAIPYATHTGNFWYFSDTPFDYIAEEDRYIAFADLLHDILGIDHPESHSAIIRLEDVAPSMYPPEVLQQTANLLRSNNIPYAVALVPVYKDPLGYYSGGIPEEHRISNAADAESVAFLSVIRYMVTNGAQLILHGYTHQYGSVPNPYDGVTGDDFEFWRETFQTNNPNPFAIDLYMPVPEDSPSWVMGRINAAKAELSAVGLTAVGWEFPHYSASALDYSIFATNFPLVMERRLYFDNAGHVAGQFFPYVINRDTYGQKIIPENIGNIEPTTWADYPSRLPEDLIRAAKKNLVVRDGWANGYFHPFYDLTNLQAVITGIKALGYTYVQVSPTKPPTIITQPQSLAVLLGGSASFNVAVDGTSPFGYRWRFNGANIANATNNSFTIASTLATNAGNYTVVITNTYGSVTSAVAVLTVNIPATITTQPQSRTNLAGTIATFSVTAAGTATLNYQWRFNGTNLTGATAATLSLTNVQPASAGNYTVVVTNTSSSVTSAVAVLTVATPPTITVPPANQTNLIGSTATFSVTAAGTATLAYQWRFNNANIAGATGSTLTLINVQTTNVGNYIVVVTNAYGSITSTVATLTITGAAPSIVTQPASQTNATGTTATFNVAAAGTGTLAYRWQFNSANIAGATNATLALSSVQSSNAGNYNVVITNAFGSTTSAVVTLSIVTAPLITAQPVSQTSTVGSTATFSVTATGTATLNYQWRFNGTNLVGATGATLNLSNVQITNAGNYSVVITNAYGLATSAVATLAITGTAPVITAQPSSQTNVVGTTANFNSTATGTAPINYQWRLNSTNIASATNATLALTNVQATNAGGYTVVANNSFGSTTSIVATLTVVTTPLITVQPQNQTNGLGTTATFSVTATGTATLNYQWRFNGTNIASATNATFTFGNVQLVNVGNYAVVISNPFGSVTSAPASLAVTGTVPSITTQPASQTILTGSQVTFSVTASGSSPLIYQWRFNGTNLAGATNVTLSFNTQAASAGGYSVIVGNAFGAVTSTVVTLTLGTAPAVTTQPQNQTNGLGSTATFNVTATGTATLIYQWRFNGANLTGATGATLALSNVQASNAGNYTVVITNTFGSTTSAMAALTFASPPAVTTQPQSQTSSIGATAIFTVAAGGSSPLSYQWRFNGANIASATGSSLTLTNLQTANAGNYSVVVANTYGSVTSSVAVLNFFTPPASLSGKTYRWQRDNNGLGGVYAFSTSTYTWTPNSGAASSGSYSLQLINGQAIIATYIWTGLGSGYDMTYNTLTYTNTDAGTFTQWLYSAAANQWTLYTGIFGPVVTSVPPTITSQPISQAATVGATVNFTVGVGGSSPFGYQWRFNGVNLAGATGATLALSNVQISNTGNYSVVITNAFGAVTSTVAALTVTGTPPSITTQPASQAATVGATASLTVNAGGSSPLNYQWRFNGVNIVGATGSTLTLTSLQTNNAGNYTVVITNAFGSVTSAVATLTVTVSTAASAPASLAGLIYYLHDLDNNVWGAISFAANGTWMRTDSSPSGYIYTSGYYAYSKTGPNSATLVVANSATQYNYYVLAYTGAGVGTYVASYVVNGQVVRTRTGEFVKP